MTDLLDEIQATATQMSSVDSLAGMSAELAEAVESGRQALTWLLDNGKQDRNAVGAASVNYMMLMGYLCGGWIMGQSALKASQAIESGSGEKAFMTSKLITSRFYFDHLLPRTASYLSTVLAGSDSMMALDEGQF